MKKLPAITFPLFVLIFAGCSKTADISGKVTLDGKPVLSGTVMMARSPKGVPLYGVIKNDGSYSLKEVPVGPVYVAVNSPQRVAAPPKDFTKPPPPPPPEITGWFPIPPKYNDFLSSGLKFMVEEGHNTYDIELAGAARSSSP